MKAKDVRESDLLADEARLSLITAAVVGAMEVASAVGEDGATTLRKALFLCALRAAALREKARSELRSA
jgi:hypothetical protein